MKGAVLAVWIWTGLLFSGTLIGQLGTWSLPPAGTAAPAARVTIVTGEPMIAPRSSLTGRPDCVGFPRSRALAPSSSLDAPLSLVTAGLLRWA